MVRVVIQKVTTDRVRGPKGNKVLRTRKINQSSEYIRNSVWSVFCSQGCYTDFFTIHWGEVIKIAPRDKPLETPIEDPRKVTKHEVNGIILVIQKLKKELTMIKG